jgi:hypothetical protein
LCTRSLIVCKRVLLLTFRASMHPLIGRHDEWRVLRESKCLLLRPGEPVSCDKWVWKSFVGWNAGLSVWQKISKRSSLLSFGEEGIDWIRCSNVSLIFVCFYVCVYFAKLI